MPRSSGTFTPPASSWYPAVSGNAANFGDWNNLLADLSAALTQSLSQDGQTNPTANLPMAGFKHTGVGNAAGTGQYIAWGQNCTLGTVTVSGMAGDGSGLTALNASSLSTGTIPDARFPATLPSGVAVATAAQFDNTTKPASTAFVQRALGNLAGTATYNTSTNLLVADLGKWIFVPSGTGSISLALPTTAVTTGSQYRIYNNTVASNVTITTTGAITSGASGGLGSIVIGPGQTFDFTTDGANNWVVSQGDFASQARLPTGLNASGSAPMYVARAWITFNGTGTAASLAAGNITLTDNGVGDYTLTFTTAMPDANYAVVGTATGGGAAQSVVATIRSTGSSVAPTLKTTAAVRVQTSDPDSFEDSTCICFVVFR